MRRLTDFYVDPFEAERSQSERFRADVFACIALGVYFGVFLESLTR